MQVVDERMTTKRLTDERLEPLVERAREGDLEAFEQVVRTLQGPVRAFTRRMMRDPHLGDDAAQETFVRIWRGLSGYRPSGRFVAWAFTVARNTCVEHIRKEARTPVPVEEHEAQHPDPSEIADLRGAVSEALRGLGEPYRSTFLLRESGLAYEEIADTLRCPVGTVRSRLHEARRLLAEALAPFLSGGDE